jgi:hypothetical protein
LENKNTCNYAWGNILKLRGIARKFIQFKVGDGRSIYLWHDWWHPEFYMRILDIVLSMMLVDKVSSVLKEGNWCWRVAR